MADSAAASPASAAPVQAAPAKPLLVGPEIAALFGASRDPSEAPPADAGAPSGDLGSGSKASGNPAAGLATAGSASPGTVTGPVLGAESVELEDTWTLPQTPKSFRVALRHAKALEVRVDDPDRLPWAIRSVAHGIDAAGTATVDVMPLHGLASGSRYVLVIEGEFVDAGTRTWTIPVSVEIGADGPAPWQEKAPAPKTTRKKRRR